MSAAQQKLADAIAAYDAAREAVSVAASALDAAKIAQGAAYQACVAARRDVDLGLSRATVTRTSRFGGNAKTEPWAIVKRTAKTITARPIGIVGSEKQFRESAYKAGEWHIYPRHAGFSSERLVLTIGGEE